MTKAKRSVVILWNTGGRSGICSDCGKALRKQDRPELFQIMPRGKAAILCFDCGKKLAPSITNDLEMMQAAVFIADEAEPKWRDKMQTRFGRRKE